MRDTFHGHFWTLRPHVLHRLVPTRPPVDDTWSIEVDDETFGRVRLSGSLRHSPGADTVVVMLHGMGGSARSRYCARAAKAVLESGHSYLRLNLRGADLSGEDFYHAGLTEDLRATLRSEALARYQHILILGYSLGGHIALRWAVEEGRDSRVRAIATVCSPLDLNVAAKQIQRPWGKPYQWHVLRGLKSMYRATALRREVPIPVEDALKLKTVLEWDELIVAPRFGFADRRDYYVQTSVGPRLSQLELPTLFIATEADPMVRSRPLRIRLRRAPEAMKVHWLERGGHVGFPDDLDLGVGDAGPLEPQLMRWFERQLPNRQF